MRGTIHLVGLAGFRRWRQWFALYSRTLLPGLPTTGTNNAILARPRRGLPRFQVASHYNYSTLLAQPLDIAARRP